MSKWHFTHKDGSQVDRQELDSLVRKDYEHAGIERMSSVWFPVIDEQGHLILVDEFGGWHGTQGFEVVFDV